jgi:prevent-host-death family protein
MTFTPKDIISINQARAKLTELCDEVRTTGSEKIITKNGSSCAALIDANRLDYYHRLEREHIHLGLLEEAIKGLADVKAGKTLSRAQLTSRHDR